MDTLFSDSTATAAGTSFVAAWMNPVNRWIYWGRNPIFGTTTGSANAQVLTLPATSLYTAVALGDQFTFKAGTTLTNTTTCTLQIVGASAITAGTIKNPDGTNLIAGAITAGGIYTVVALSATVWILTSNPAVISIAVGSITGLGTGVATFLATPSSANLAAALTDETGSGAAVFANSPSLITPALGTPASGVLTNMSGAGTWFPLPMRATTDQSITTNTTLANATNFGFSIGASEEWVVEYLLPIGDGLSTTGFKLAIVTPASATQRFDVTLSPEQVDAGSANVQRFYRSTTSSGTAVDFTATNCAGSSIGFVRASAWVLNSTNAGTVQLQIAQSTSSGTALVNHTGAFGIARRIA